ncbi:hypothetical protein [Herbaspirillum sp. YR522]|uniref:hypothetical protein n=1 Tax=Herbaspirillum sp. YR522 TaxID=1144342 RepID=UPI00026F659A|nr:hypothetical protein [Herbaspirillum sp. YR522]EJM97311.1 hypothetical protein PMI40_04463 [Herbaspirillum sp. YR522]
MPCPLPPGATASLRSLHLSPGQTLRIWLPAGVTLVSNGPALTVGSARWIAGQLLQQCQRLDDGQSLRLEQGGWAQISATGGGELLCLAPARRHWTTRLARAARQFAAWIRSAYRSKDLSGISKIG